MRQKNYRIRQLAVAAIGAVTAVSGIAVLGAGTAQAAGPNTTVVSMPPATELRSIGDGHLQLTSPNATRSLS